MSRLIRNVIIRVTFLLTTAPLLTQAQQRKGELYFSWGYNTEWYTHSNVGVYQPNLGNNYSFRNITGHDHKGWDEGLFSKALSIPQYNYRLGYVFNKKKGLAFEINFDHTKFIFSDQNARLKGQLNGKIVDTTIAFNAQNGFFWYLNNGANFLLFNIVKRWKVYEKQNGKVKIDFMAKGGVGPVIPHVENELFGEKNKPHFQSGGWNVGAEGALRATFYKKVYLEFANKVDYARYAQLQIYEGFAKQAFGTYEMILSLGVTIPAGKKQK